MPDIGTTSGAAQMGSRALHIAKAGKFIGDLHSMNGMLCAQEIKNPA
jgi:hypothetical protein